MQQTLTVRQTIWRGRLVLTLPIILMALVWIAAIVGNMVFNNAVINKYVSAGTFVLFCIVAWLYNGFMFPRWYIWALRNVRNVHELRQRAAFGLASPDTDRAISRFYFISAAQKQELGELNKKFDVPDEFTDDATVPEVTNIYIALTRQVFVAVVMAVVLAAGVTLIVTHTYLVGIGLSAFSTYVLVDSIRRITNRTPQITLSKEGIATASTPFHPWAEVSDEIVGREYDSETRSDVHYLAYNFPGGDEKVYLYGLRTNHWRLAKQLRVYRGRSGRLG